jgi:hypothetical protein
VDEEIASEQARCLAVGARLRGLGIDSERVFIDAVQVAPLDSQGELFSIFAGKVLVTPTGDINGPLSDGLGSETLIMTAERPAFCAEPRGEAAAGE